MPINLKQKRKTGKMRTCLKLKMSMQKADIPKVQSMMKEYRRVFNEYIKLWNQTGKYSKIFFETHKFQHELLANTKQAARDVAVEAIKSFLELKKEDPDAKPPQVKDVPMSPRLNFNNGYMIFKKVDETGKARYIARVSIKGGERIKVELVGSKSQIELLDEALSGEQEFGSCSINKLREKYFMNISLTIGEIPLPKNEKIFIGMDNNERNICLSAVNVNGEVLRSLVVDFPIVNIIRQKFFKIRKRLQQVKKLSVRDKLKDKEKRMIRDFFHKISRLIVDWAREFQAAVIVMEDLKNIRNSINFGKKWNRRLHGWGFRQLQDMIKYKAQKHAIPVIFVEPQDTSKTCVRCGIAKRSNKKKRRFKCSSCGHVDHRDRNATLNIALKGMNKLIGKVPRIKNFPIVRKVRFLALGPANLPSSAILHGSGKDSSEVKAGSLILKQCLASRLRDDEMPGFKLSERASSRPWVPKTGLMREKKVIRLYWMAVHLPRRRKEHDTDR